MLVQEPIEKEFSEEDADNNVVQVFDAIAEKWPTSMNFLICTLVRTKVNSLFYGCSSPYSKSHLQKAQLRDM